MFFFFVMIFVVQKFCILCGIYISFLVKLDCMVGVFFFWLIIKYFIFLVFIVEFMNIIIFFVGDSYV